MPFPASVARSRAIERAPYLSKEVTTSTRWLNEIHAEEEMAAARAQVDAIKAERDAYAARLAAGNVPPEELALRSFAEHDVKPFQVPINGMAFLRIEQYGPLNYFVLQDLRKQQYRLPYDRRLEPLLEGLFDVVRVGKEFEIRPSMRPDGRTAIPLPEFFTKTTDSAEAAADALRTHAEFVRERRFLNTMTDVEELEAEALEKLAALATAKAS